MGPQQSADCVIYSNSRWLCVLLYQSLSQISGFPAPLVWVNCSELLFLWKIITCQAISACLIVAAIYQCIHFRTFKNMTKLLKKSAWCACLDCTPEPSIIIALLCYREGSSLISRCMLWGVSRVCWFPHVLKIILIFFYVKYFVYSSGKSSVLPDCACRQRERT